MPGYPCWPPRPLSDSSSVVHPVRFVSFVLSWLLCRFLGSGRLLDSEKGLNILYYQWHTHIRPV